MNSDEGDDARPGVVDERDAESVEARDDAAADSAAALGSVAAPLLQNVSQSASNPGNGHDDGIDETKFVCPCEIDDTLTTGWPPMPLIVQVCALLLSCASLTLIGRHRHL